MANHQGYVNGNQTFDLFRFPVRPKLRARWLAACGITQVMKNTGVCLNHFAPEDVMEPIGSQVKMKLKLNAVPTLQVSL